MARTALTRRAIIELGLPRGTRDLIEGIIDEHVSKAFFHEIDFLTVLFITRDRPV